MVISLEREQHFYFIIYSQCSASLAEVESFTTLLSLCTNEQMILFLNHIF